MALSNNANFSCDHRNTTDFHGIYPKMLVVTKYNTITNTKLWSTYLSL